MWVYMSLYQRSSRSISLSFASLLIRKMDRMYFSRQSNPHLQYQGQIPSQPLQDIQGSSCSRLRLPTLLFTRHEIHLLG